MADASMAPSPAGDDSPQQAIVAAAARLLHVDIACLYDVAQVPHTLGLVACAGGSAGSLDALRRLPLDAPSLAGAAARLNIAQVAPEDESAADALLDAGHLRRRCGCTRAFAIPIAFAGTLRAVLLCATAQPALPQNELIEIAGALASLFGMALTAPELHTQRARIEELERENHELERAREQLHATIAEARQTEAALRLSEDSLARAQRLAKLGNWDWHISSNELLWSDECYRMLGLSRDAGALTYERFLNCIHPEDREGVIRSVDLALQGTLPYCVDYRIVRPNGEERFLHTEADVIRAEDGSPLRMIGTALDVTEQRRADRALRLSEERLRMIAEHASDVIFHIRLGPEGGYEYINPAVLEHTGYPPAAWYENPELFVTLIHPEDVGRYHAFVQHMAAAGGRLTFRIIDRSGRTRWVSTHITIQRDEHGNPIAGIGISRDVTTEKLADEERDQLLGQLAAERRWLHAVIERSPVGILLLDRAGAPIARNRRAQELAGTDSPPGLPGAWCLCLPDGEPLTDEEQPSAGALRGEVTSSRELSLRRADGSMLAVLASAGPIVDGNGKLLGAVVVFDDITRLKELERLKEEWTSVVAHDLKQPVTTIIGYATQLERKPQITTAVKTRAGHILASAKRLGRMVSDLTDISQIESRRLAIERAPTDLRALVEAVVERMGSETEGRPVDVESRGEIPFVHADAGRVEQVLSNLISNAVKYGAPETPIQVALERRDDAVQISIRNSGRGIPAQDLPLLFERFFRGKAKDERVVGLGLGLYIAKGLVEAHDGRIWVESPEVGHTTFHFTLPVAAAPRRDAM